MGRHRVATDGHSMEPGWASALSRRKQGFETPTGRIDDATNRDLVAINDVRVVFAHAELLIRFTSASVRCSTQFPRLATARERSSSLRRGSGARREDNPREGGKAYLRSRHPTWNEVRVYFAGLHLVHLVKSISSVVFNLSVLKCVEFAFTLRMCALVIMRPRRGRFS